MLNTGRMKHVGKARSAGLKIIIWSLVAAVGVFVIGALCALLVEIAKLAAIVLMAIGAALIALWLLFALFTVYFFRDPNPKTPGTPNIVVSPAHGKVDAIEQITEDQFLGARCHRISTFLSVIDIHVQNAPVAGKVSFLKHTPGQFLSALKVESASQNENVLLGFESTENPGHKIGVRLIAGVLARRIIPFVALDDQLQRGERISLIQFGSRCDLYFPLDYKIQVKIGDHVVGGETVMAVKS
jgi:phosphatidylserine decarboxylase